MDTFEIAHLIVFHSGCAFKLNLLVFLFLQKPNVMPDIKCPFWMRITYLWFTTVVINGYRKIVKFEKLFDLSHDNTCYSLVPKYLKYYKKSPKELKNSPPNVNKGQNHNSIYWTLWGSVGYLQVIATLLRLLSVPIQFINPQLLE